MGGEDLVSGEEVDGSGPAPLLVVEGVIGGGPKGLALSPAVREGQLVDGLVGSGKKARHLAVDELPGCLVPREHPVSGPEVFDGLEAAIGWNRGLGLEAELEPLEGPEAEGAPVEEELSHHLRAFVVAHASHMEPPVGKGEVDALSRDQLPSARVDGTCHQNDSCRKCCEPLEIPRCHVQQKTPLNDLILP